MGLALKGLNQVKNLMCLFLVISKRSEIYLISDHLIIYEIKYVYVIGRFWVNQRQQMTNLKEKIIFITACSLVLLLILTNRFILSTNIKLLLICCKSSWKRTLEGLELNSNFLSFSDCIYKKITNIFPYLSESLFKLNAELSLPWTGKILFYENNWKEVFKYKIRFL